MSYVTFMKLIITSVLAIYGLTPFWCDSCGNTYLDTEKIECENCGAWICEQCADLYEGEHGDTCIGCYVCNGGAGIIGHDNADDVQPIEGLFN